MYEKFAASFRPRPPDTMMSASAIDSSPASGVFVSTSFDFDSGAWYAMLTTSAAPLPASSGGKAFGRVVAMAGLLTTSTVANALPEYTGRRARSLPSVHSRRSTSEATPAFTRAAMRGARSRPFDVPPKRTTAGCARSMACFSAAAYGSVV